MRQPPLPCLLGPQRRMRRKPARRARANSAAATMNRLSHASLPRNPATSRRPMSPPSETSSKLTFQAVQCASLRPNSPTRRARRPTRRPSGARTVAARRTIPANGHQCVQSPAQHHHSPNPNVRSSQSRTSRPTCAPSNAIAAAPGTRPQRLARRSRACSASLVKTGSSVSCHANRCSRGQCGAEYVPVPPWLCTPHYPSAGTPLAANGIARCGSAD